MSFSDSEVPQGGEYKTFRQVSRDRLLHEMLGASKSDKARSSWKVLIMDKVTVKVMSSTCKMADITDQGVSLVEDIFRRREPLPSLDAVYFIQPLKENIVLLLSDMSGREPLYKKAYVYFSSPVPKDLVARIKNDVTVVPRIGALREMNLEYFPMDNQAFVTDHERALEDLFGEGAENSRKFDASLNEMAKRIATVFASLKEFPVVRYQAPKGQDSSSVVSPRHLLPTKLASAIWNVITTYKDSIPNFPKTETCEFLILDRSVDMIAPVIHEWTYDCMCHDLLDMDGNKYVNEVSSDSGGPPTRKEALLEDQDPVWVEIRHSHIADASIKLSDKMDNFLSKNKAAQMHQRDGEDISAREMQRVVQSLSQYNEQKDRLSLHTEIAGKLNQLIRDLNLRDLGQLEQDLVFGDAGTKEVINYFRTNQDASDENKLRLMIIYACVSPEKFEGDKAAKLMQLAKLSSVDMKAVKNMKLIEGGSDNNSRKSSGFSLKFDTKKKNAAARKDRTGEEEQWALFRFFPVIEELVENLSKGQLSKDEYKSVNQVNSAVSDANGSSHGGSSKGTQPNPHSMRSRRTATWAKPRMSDDGNASDSVLKNFDAKKMGQRIFVFIIGGATRSELRVCHKLTTKLRREVILGSTSMDDPPVYITKLKMLSEKELSVADIRI